MVRQPDPAAETLSKDLLEQVLLRLGCARRPDPTLEGLRTLYSRWCQRVPFDNVRKLIHVRQGNSGPLPGVSAPEFLKAWVRFGTGGTCWSGAGAFHALLRALGFEADRAVGTMLVAPNLPPNHGSVRVRMDHDQYLVDCSILHGDPLRLCQDAGTSIEHPAWGVQCTQRDARWHVWWRPLHKTDGFECRLEHFGAPAEEFNTRHEATRGWSPFNYELSARLNRGNTVIGAGFGLGVTLMADGAVRKEPLSHAARTRLLVEDFGMSEEIVSQLPEDIPTPPPPGSHAARASN